MRRLEEQDAASGSERKATRRKSWGSRAVSVTDSNEEGGELGGELQTGPAQDRKSGEMGALREERHHAGCSGSSRG